MGWTYRDAGDGESVCLCFLSHLIPFHIFDLSLIFENEMMSWCVEKIFSLNVHHLLLDGFDMKRGTETLDSVQLMTLFAFSILLSMSIPHLDWIEYAAHTLIVFFELFHQQNFAVH